MDFYKPACQTASITSSKFGLCDDQIGNPAYVDTDNPAVWIATVKNDTGLELTFTAIDKCVILDNEASGRGRCDGMLTSRLHLYFIELKSARHADSHHAKEQLISTIRFFQEIHPDHLKNFTHRKAFICNKRQRGFVVIDQEEQLRFRREYGFRLDIQNQVLVV